MYCLVVFYDKSGTPIDFVSMVADRIPAGLAKRMTGLVDSSVQELTESGRVELRIVDFRIVE